MEGENIAPTYHQKIKIFTGSSMDYGKLSSWIDTAKSLLLERQEERIVAHLRKVVPELNSLRWIAARADQSLELETELVSQYR